MALKYYVKKDEKKEKKVLTRKERCATIKTEKQGSGNPINRQKGKRNESITYQRLQMQKI